MVAPSFIALKSYAIIAFINYKGYCELCTSPLYFKYTSICIWYTSFQPFFPKFVILSSFGSCKEDNQKTSTLKFLPQANLGLINLCTYVLKHTGKIQHVKNLWSRGILKWEISYNFLLNLCEIACSLKIDYSTFMHYAKSMPPRAHKNGQLG